jgi:hypothetical protein
MTFAPLTRDRLEPPLTSDDWKTEHRARIAHEESERLERKQQELLEQRSERNTPAERIRIWERRHGLTLPRATNHRLLAIVAAGTNLALHQVSEEQQRRLGGTKTEAVVTPTAV